MPDTLSQSTSLRVAVIGCGRPWKSEKATGFGMAHRHMAGYAASGRCQLVAVAELVRENADAFIATHGPTAEIFHDYHEMMERIRPDVVSVCLWPHLHAEVVCALAEFKPRVIFCEKPMDIHWDAALRMHESCVRHGVLLAINHQRRFNLPILRAKELLDGGAIGPLLRMEGAWGNLADSGTHVLDLMFFFNRDTPADWVLGQIDLRGAKHVFGAVQVAQSVTEIRFRNGVRALFRSGRNHEENGCLLRLIGENGVIEILFDAPWLQIRRAGQVAWEIVETGESIHDDLAIHRGTKDVFAWLEGKGPSQLASERALRATEVIFATHESARRRGRVDLPLPSGPDAMLTMLARGELTAEFAD
jgi:predicted dehydrogenase